MLSLVLYFQGSNAKEGLLGDLFNLVEKTDTHIYILKIRNCHLRTQIILLPVSLQLPISPSHSITVRLCKHP